MYSIPPWQYNPYIPRQTKKEPPKKPLEGYVCFSALKNGGLEIIIAWGESVETFTAPFSVRDIEEMVQSLSDAKITDVYQKNEKICFDLSHD